MDRLKTLRRLLAVAKTGQFYSHDAFDQERYAEMLSLLTALLADLSQTPVTKLQLQFAADDGYVTPKVDVRALIRRGQQVLLVQDQNTKTWSLPGGFAEVNQSPQENVCREVQEETGLTVTTARLVGIYDTNLRPDIPQVFQYYKLIFDCQIETGAFVPNIETTQRRYFAITDLPPLSVKRTTAAQLQQLMTAKTLICE
ncbi:NUDIX hydrolase N-terminal domain-containing protein [Lactiplantibacillus daowaiensis]|uniref:NUDIX hydrolase N-terminal domain-containing protein n=1 Tax=Lactiplantibacillus daowaiensis TaxID=2559918 RepID=A0ABW1S1E8_9LACO|nr:NUDIX hydrolase N-terminal domain-containing protein [Lactiplantibacillus daowaiensis]